MFTIASLNKLTDEEKKSMPPCSRHDRNEHTIRAAIKTIIWDLMLSNSKAKAFITKQPRPVIVQVL